jgi:hypothetical protein
MNNLVLVVSIRYKIYKLRKRFIRGGKQDDGKLYKMWFFSLQQRPRDSSSTAQAVSRVAILQHMVVHAKKRKGVIRL